MTNRYARLAVIGGYNATIKEDIKQHLGSSETDFYDLRNDVPADAVVIVGNGLAVSKDYADKAFSKGTPVYLYILPAEGARGNNFPNTHKCGERTKNGAHILKVGSNWKDIGDGTVAMLPC